MARVRLLYAAADCLVKVNGAVLAPFHFGRGVRQGCPMSGQLYSVCVEPFLCLLRRRLTGLALPGPRVEVILSAYADDVLLMFTDPGDLRRMRDCQEIFSAASSARINWSKCSGLLVGQWRVDSLPEEMALYAWSTTHLLYLGVYLSPTEDVWPANWQELETKVVARLGRWSGLLGVLSFRGRVLVINQLVASMLWYRLATLVPPSIFVTAIQKKLVDFFWGNRKHWISAAVLSLPLEEGGQSLVCVRTQVAALRLRTLRRYMYVENPPRWHALATYFFRQGRCLRGVSRLPVAGVSRPALRGLPVFYRDVFKSEEFGGVQPECCSTRRGGCCGCGCGWSSSCHGGCRGEARA